MIKIYLLSLLSLIIFPFQISADVLSGELSGDLVGKLEGSTYTSKNGVFVTELPADSGEMRDVANAVSIYSAQTGSQDSIEYYPIPPKQQEKYKNEGAEEYLANHLKNAVIEGRYKGTFKNVEIVDEQLKQINNQDFYITTIEIPQGSSIKKPSGSRGNLWVALGALIDGNHLFLYQVAVSDIGLLDSETIKQSISQKA